MPVRPQLFDMYTERFSSDENGLRMLESEFSGIQVCTYRLQEVWRENDLLGKAPVHSRTQDDEPLDIGGPKMRAMNKAPVMQVLPFDLTCSTECHALASLCHWGVSADERDANREDRPGQSITMCCSANRCCQ